MNTIPAINCENLDCVLDKLNRAKEFSDWVHIDISDGKFSNYKTWDNPQELISNPRFPKDLNIELHLMVENPEKEIEKWLDAGIKRVIVHFKAIKKTAARNYYNDLLDVLNLFFGKYKKNNLEFCLAISNDVSAEALLPYLDRLKFIQILAVNPGLSGQEFQSNVIAKINFLRNASNSYLNINIEVDGGINLETARQVKEAGASTIVSASYIWDSSDPKKAFEELNNI